MTTEVSANHLIEAQTRAIEREFKCSRPRPRNRAMGFAGRDNDFPARNSRNTAHPRPERHDSPAGENPHPD